MNQDFAIECIARF